MREEEKMKECADIFSKEKKKPEGAKRTLKGIVGSLNIKEAKKLGRP